jgi:hypothetical protein
VLFRRHTSGFEIDVAPWDDDAAIAWRAASETLGTVFRLGKVGSRICGLFKILSKKVSAGTATAC